MTHLTRRSFLKSSGKMAACGLLLGVATPASAAYSFRFTYEDSFNGTWVPWLQRVVGVASRLIQRHVITNCVRLTGNAHNITGEAWQKSNLINNPNEYWRHPSRLMEWQLASLQVNNFQLSFRILWGFEKNENWWGKANYNTIALVYNPRSNDVDLEGYNGKAGTFEIRLNAYWATTNDQRNNDSTWGGVIAHEMLHNLGHRHEQPQSYDDRWPINIMDRCVSNNGNYRGGFRDSSFLCGGRLT